MTNTEQLNATIGKKTRKPIDLAYFVDGLMKASESKKTLPQFVSESMEKYGWNEKSISQKYYSYRADLQAKVDNKDLPEETRNDAVAWLKRLELADGRKGAGNKGRKPIDRLQKLNELMAKMGELKATNDGKIGQSQTVVNPAGQSQSVITPAGQIDIKDGTITIHAGNQTITVEQDSN